MTRVPDQRSDHQGLATGPAPFTPDSASEAGSCDGTRLRADGLAAPAFQREILGLLAAHPDLEPASVGPFRARITCGWRAFDVRLDELFKRYRHGEVTPAAAAEEIKAALGVSGTAVQPAGPFPRLAPVAGVPAAARAVPCPFDPALAVFFVHTLPSGHVPLRRGDGAEDSTLWAQSVANLRALTLPLPVSAAGEGPRLLLRYEIGDGLDAARGLLPDLLATMAGWVHGRALAALPTRDLLVVIGDGDSAFVDQTRAWVAERHARDPFPVAPHWYVVAGDGSLVRGVVGRPE